MTDKKITTKYWDDAAKSILLGKKIIDVRYMTAKEADASGLSCRPIVMWLDDGTQIFPMMDDEGNDAGALCTTDKKHGTLPVLYQDFV